MYKFKKEAEEVKMFLRVQDETIKDFPFFLLEMMCIRLRSRHQYTRYRLSVCVLRDIKMNSALTFWLCLQKSTLSCLKEEKKNTFVLSLWWTEMVWQNLWPIGTS